MKIQQASAATEHTWKFGYLSIWAHDDHGYLGGYLILCSRGRPLEFHCTAPVRPNRAQEILYGPTLRPYLLGEKIGRGLLAATSLTPHINLTDHADLLCLRSWGNVPLVLLSAPERPETVCKPTEHGRANRSGREPWLALPPPSTSFAPVFTVGGYEFSLPTGHGDERDECIALLAPLGAHIDLAEPFERIQLAICEAQRIGSGQVDEAPDAAA